MQLLQHTRCVVRAATLRVTLCAAAPQHTQQRRNATTAAAQGHKSVGVPLAFDKFRFGVKQTAANSSISTAVFSHCLLGNKSMWGQRFTRQLDHLLTNSGITLDAYMVDARNHGDSPHTDTHTVSDMTADIDAFVRAMKLKRPFIVGFSMVRQ